MQIVLVIMGQAVVDKPARAPRQSANPGAFTSAGQGSNRCSGARATCHNRHGFACRAVTFLPVGIARPGRVIATGDGLIRWRGRFGGIHRLGRRLPYYDGLRDYGNVTIRGSVNGRRHIT